MDHATPLIATIVMGLGLAFVFGALAHRLRLSPLVGYLLAGVAVGPFTPGFVADPSLAAELAEIGVILLMFGVGLHFSVKDLMAVKAIAIPGAIVQIAVATIFGVGLALALGWSLGGGLVFGLALSVASTVVLLRALQQRRLVETERGRIAVGWLIVEDLAMVLALVLLPAIAGLAGTHEAAEAATSSSSSGLLVALLVTLGKVVAFIALMLIVGRRVIPWILHYVAHTGSRELFRLAVLAIALGVAYGAANLFGVSFALGAFFAGMILAESELSQQATEETLPLRDAFAVLFFVSVGMLVDPSILVTEPLTVLATLAIIIVVKSVAALVIVRAFRHPTGTALTISASLAQIGEFSFILATLGVELGLMPEEGRDLILAGAILSILLNPLVFLGADRLRVGLERRAARRALPAPVAEAEETAEPTDETALVPTALAGHAVIVGCGRVGSVVAGALRERRQPFLVIEDADKRVAALRAEATEVIVGNAARPEVLAAANLAGARHLIIAIPNAFEAGQIVEQARRLNPGLDIVARAHADAEVEHLTSLGATTVIMGEREIAFAMIDHVAEAADAPQAA
jgi:CPA2 family monovalent cation:H+ antiporter-2